MADFSTVVPADDPARTGPAPSAQWFQTLFDRLVRRIELRLTGKRDRVERAVICLLAGGHLLIEDVPGLGKTSLARGLADALEGSLVRRIQGTPDLLPSDIIGTPVYRPDTGRFEFQPGPLFANVVLFDEVNRTSPRTQSALLEAMQEGDKVTVGGRDQPLPQPFFVVATQNPVELAGTYPLPEAQLDRFLMRISLGYPSAETELAILRGFSTSAGAAARDAGPPAVRAGTVAALIGFAERVAVRPSVEQYLVALVTATRRDRRVRLGASPRASLALLRAARVHAAARGHAEVDPDDVQALAADVLAHRILLRDDGGLDPDASLLDAQRRYVEELLRAVPTPKRR